MKKIWMVALLTAALTGCRAQAQSWVTVAQEGDTVSSPAPMTYRFGTPAGVTPALAGATPCTTLGGCWDPAVVGPGPVLVDSSSFGGVDPAYGTAKVLQVLQTTSAQSVTDVAADGTSTPVSIAAFVPLSTFHFSVNVNGYTIRCDLGPAADGTMTDVSCAVEDPTTGSASTK